MPQEHDLLACSDITKALYVFVLCYWLVGAYDLHVAGDLSAPKLRNYVVSNRALLTDTDTEGQTLLARACMSGRPDLLCVLIEYGVDVSDPQDQYSDGVRR